MEYRLLLAGLGLSLGGALVAAAADAWLSRALLVYLDALEANLGKVAEALRRGGQPDVTGIDLGRDRGQDRARALKTLGWLALALGFGLQIVAVCLAKPPP